MSLPVVDVIMLSGGAVFLFVGAILAFVGARAANAGHAAREDADQRLAATAALSADITRLIEKVEQSMDQRDAALERAYLARAHEAEAAAQDEPQFADERHDAQLDDDHGVEEAHRQEHAAFSTHGGEQGDLHIEAEDEGEFETDLAAEAKPSLLARLFRRAA